MEFPGLGTLINTLTIIGGAALGTYLTISEPWVAVYLALFAGFIIYIATSHILPEAHSRHSSRYTMASTLLGVVIMWLVVSAL